MQEILKSFCDKNINNNSSRMAAVIKDVKNYIDINYSDSNLTAGFIAEKFNITSSYLSVMFKKY